MCTPFSHGLDTGSIAHIYGMADTTRLAAQACEDCCDAVMAGTWPGVTPEQIARLLENDDRSTDDVDRRAAAGMCLRALQTPPRREAARRRFLCRRTDPWRGR